MEYLLDINGALKEGEGKDNWAEQKPKTLKPQPPNNKKRHMSELAAEGRRVSRKNFSKVKKTI